MLCARNVLEQWVLMHGMWKVIVKEMQGEYLAEILGGYSFTQKSVSKIISKLGQISG